MYLEDIFQYFHNVDLKRFRISIITFMCFNQTSSWYSVTWALYLQYSRILNKINDVMWGNFFNWQLMSVSTWVFLLKIFFFQKTLLTVLLDKLFLKSFLRSRVECLITHSKEEKDSKNFPQTFFFLVNNLNPPPLLNASFASV